MNEIDRLTADYGREEFTTYLEAVEYAALAERPDRIVCILRQPEGFVVSWRPKPNSR